MCSAPVLAILFLATGVVSLQVHDLTSPKAPVRALVNAKRGHMLNAHEELARRELGRSKKIHEEAPGAPAGAPVAAEKKEGEKKDGGGGNATLAYGSMAFNITNYNYFELAE